MEEKLISCIKKIRPYQGEIKLTDKINEDLGIDSLDLVVLIDEIEKAYHITFNISKISKDNIQTIKDLHVLIQETKENEII